MLRCLLIQFDLCGNVRIRICKLSFTEASENRVPSKLSQVYFVSNENVIQIFDDTNVGDYDMEMQSGITSIRY